MGCSLCFYIFEFMLKCFFFVFIFSVGQLPLISQSSTIEVFASSRVNLKDQEINEVFNLYKNYLNSSPDSIYNNPYWNETEKKQYHDFDFSRASIFQGGVSPEKIFSIYQPFVLSIEKQGKRYFIRTLVSSNTSDEKYVPSKVWCIQKLAAIKENNNWVLENLRPSITEKWNSYKAGLVQYHFSPKYQINVDETIKSKDFCTAIIERFNPGYNEPFDYYITDNVDDMGLLENFDFVFVGITTGKTGNGFILSAKANEYYPHEFVHKLLPKNINRSMLIDEGLAVFLGTKMDEHAYFNTMVKLATDLREEEEKFNFMSIVSQKERYHGYQTAYPAGAAICELIYREKGDGGLILLLAADTSSYDKTVAIIQKITGFSEDEIIEKWKQILDKFCD